ncbi:hypothetical protein [Salinicola aestuarinus]|uniref:hypothetical protein n=1 Tax=Salinicola aestuarinus TaxID=1949082 RepID=UPI000DA1B22B|nr:hypothetical protein [Salinicola aestuarinus]
MLTALVLLLNFIGVAIAVYQVYDIYYEQNVGDEERERAETNEAGWQGGAPAIAALREANVDPRVLEAVTAREDAARFLQPLRRRRQRLVFEDRLKVRHLPFWTSSLPRRDLRLTLLSVVLVNCLLVLFLGGLSLYTVAYQVPGDTFAWMNSEVVLMGLIYALVALTHGVAWLDRYLHDLYKIGQLMAWSPESASVSAH